MPGLRGLVFGLVFPLLVVGVSEEVQAQRDGQRLKQSLPEATSAADLAQLIGHSLLKTSPEAKSGAWREHEALRRSKRSPDYSYGFSSPDYKNHNWPSRTYVRREPYWQQSYSDYTGVDGGSKHYNSGRMGRGSLGYSTEPIFGVGKVTSGGGYGQMGYSSGGFQGGGGLGTGGGGYGTSGVFADLLPTPTMYGTGYGQTYGFASSPKGAFGAGATEGNQLGLNEEALAKYIEQLTQSQSRGSRSRSGERSGKRRRTRRRRKSRNAKGKNGKSERRRSKRRRRNSKSRRSTSGSASYSEEHNSDVISPKEARKSLATEDLAAYTKLSQASLSDPLTLGQLQSKDASALLISLFRNLLESAAKKEARNTFGLQALQQASANQQVQLQPQALPFSQMTSIIPRQLSVNAKPAPTEAIVTELNKLGSLMRKTFESMRSRLNNLKREQDSNSAAPNPSLPWVPSATITPKKVTTEDRAERFVNSRSTGLWSHFAHRHGHRLYANNTSLIKQTKMAENNPAFGTTMPSSRNINLLKVPTLTKNGPKIYRMRSSLAQSSGGLGRSTMELDQLVSAAAEAARRFIAQSPTTPSVMSPTN